MSDRMSHEYQVWDLLSRSPNGVLIDEVRKVLHSTNDVAAGLLGKLIKSKDCRRVELPKEYVRYEGVEYAKRRFRYFAVEGAPGPMRYFKGNANPLNAGHPRYTGPKPKPAKNLEPAHGRILNNEINAFLGIRI